MRCNRRSPPYSHSISPAIGYLWLLLFSKLSKRIKKESITTCIPIENRRSNVFLQVFRSPSLKSSGMYAFLLGPVLYYYRVVFSCLLSPDVWYFRPLFVVIVTTFSALSRYIHIHMHRYCLIVSSIVVSLCFDFFFRFLEFTNCFRMDYALR